MVHSQILAKKITASPRTQEDASQQISNVVSLSLYAYISKWKNQEPAVILSLIPRVNILSPPQFMLNYLQLIFWKLHLQPEVPIGQPPGKGKSGKSLGAGRLFCCYFALCFCLVGFSCCKSRNTEILPSVILTSFCLFSCSHVFFMTLKKGLW